jgi:hypothetical protein
LGCLSIENLKFCFLLKAPPKKNKAIPLYASVARKKDRYNLKIKSFKSLGNMQSV